MKKKSITLNYIYNVTYQILLIIIPLITTPYISRVLGAEGIGLYSYVESIATYFVLFATMGIATYGQREIAYVQDDREKRTKIFWNTKLFTVLVTLITFAIYIIFCQFQENKILYLIMAVNILNVACDVTWLFQGMEEFGIITFRNVFFKILNVIYIFVFVNEPDDVGVYAFGIVFLTLIANISLWFRIRKFVDAPWKIEWHPFANFRIILSLFIPTIAIQIYTVLDKTMIGLITSSDVQNGYYDQALKLSKLTLTFVTSLGTVMVPRIGYHYHSGDSQMVEKYMYKGYRFVWFLGIPLCFGLIGVIDNIVPWFYGENFEEVVTLIYILAFLILAIGINNVTGIQYLIPTGRQNIFTLTVIVGAIVNFVMNLFLIPRYLARGAALSSVVAETVIAILQLIIVRRELKPKQILRSGGVYFVAGVIMFVVLRVENFYFNASFVYSMIMILSGAVVYIFGLFFLRDDYLLNGVSTIKKKVIKERK